eukprot:Rhum_TRINITY_DN14345_c3_g1::Rhum_TRINITY_DN14345_c3_g1_i1::g.84642::m.84642
MRVLVCCSRLNLLRDQLLRQPRHARGVDRGHLDHEHEAHIAVVRVVGLIRLLRDLHEGVVRLVLTVPLVPRRSRLAAQEGEVNRDDAAALEHSDELRVVDHRPGRLDHLRLAHHRGTLPAVVPDGRVHRAQAAVHVLRRALVLEGTVVDLHLRAVAVQPHPRQTRHTLRAAHVVGAAEERPALLALALELEVRALGLRRLDGARDVEDDRVELAVQVRQHLRAQAEADILRSGGVAETVLVVDEAETVGRVAAQPPDVQDRVPLLVVCVRERVRVHRAVVARALAVLAGTLPGVGDLLHAVHDVAVLVLSRAEVQVRLERHALALRPVQRDLALPLVDGADDVHLRGVARDLERHREDVLAVEDLRLALAHRARVLKADVQRDRLALRRRVRARVAGLARAVGARPAAAGLEVDGLQAQRLVLRQLLLHLEKEGLRLVLNDAVVDADGRHEALHHAEHDLAAVRLRRLHLLLADGPAVDLHQVRARQCDGHLAEVLMARRAILALVLVRVDRVADEVQRVERRQEGKVLEVRDLVEVQREHAQVGQVAQALEGLDVVAGQRQRLQLVEAREALQRLDAVTREVEVTKAGQLRLPQALLAEGSAPQEFAGRDAVERQVQHLEVLKLVVRVEGVEFVLAQVHELLVRVVVRDVLDRTQLLLVEDKAGGTGRIPVKALLGGHFAVVAGKCLQ